MYRIVFICLVATAFLGNGAIMPAFAQSTKLSKADQRLLEAAIQSAHTQRGLGAPVPDEAIVALYDALVALQPTIGAQVSRACALGAARGPAAGLAALATLDSRAVASYQPYWAALTHLAALAGDETAARHARERAVGLATDPAVRRFLLGGG